MDYSASFGSMRSALNEETGGRYGEFVRSLEPRFGQVWRDIALGYLNLALVLFVLAVAGSSAWNVPAVLLGATLIGYWIAYLQLFLHEAAHYNLWRDKEVSDRLCDLFLSWLVGTHIGAYRAIHFPHHRKLGQADDTEPTYLNALTPLFLLRSLAGIHAVRVFRLRRDFTSGVDARKLFGSLLRGALAHFVLVAILVTAGAWSAVLSWIAGIVVFYPFFAALRQLLEHRDPGVAGNEGVTRIFGDGTFASTFGGAGFNRHLLHHWEPTISYTRLKDYECFLRGTSMAPIMRKQTTTYVRALADIWQADNRRSRVNG